MTVKRQAPKNVFNASWLFGHPVVRADNNSTAKWVKPTHVPLNQKGGGWLVELIGGIQTGDDWAACYIPVNEYPVPMFDKAQWSYYMTSTQSMGVNIVIWVHDPADFDKRAEITQLGGHADLEKTSGWNAHEFTTATAGMFFYGEGTGLTQLTAGTQYTWAQFQADPLFQTWVIYRITLEYGWEASGTFGPAYLAEVKLNEVPVPLIPPQLDALEELSIAQPMFGKPTLTSNNNGKATWFKSGTSPFDQKSSTSWLAELYGGVQSGWNDWARLNIPVNEMRLTDLRSTMWSYYMTENETFGVNMVIFVHDPTDFDKRAEITQLGSISGLEKVAGWNAHELNVTTDQFFFYGEGVTGSALTKAAPNYYGIDDFQADVLFKDFTIYRITFDNGWQTDDNEFKSAYVADVKINGEMIPLYPDTRTYTKIVNTQKTLEADGTYAAKDVMSDNDSDGVGTAWTWEFGGTGKIVAATALCSATRTSVLTLYLYSALPTCELDDNSANNGPLVADMPNYVGNIVFPALANTSGPSYSTVTPALTTGNLPLAFANSKLWGVLVDITGEDYGDDEPMNILLTAELVA